MGYCGSKMSIHNKEQKPSEAAASANNFMSKVGEEQEL